MSGQPTTDNNLIEDVAEFYAAIDRASLTHKLSAERPYVYTTMEIYDVNNGIRGAGGLGVLAADTRRVAEDLEIPFVMLTPFYREERHQTMNDFVPQDNYTPRKPTDFGFQKVGDVPVKIADKPEAMLEIYEKICGSTRFLTISEDNFGVLYGGDSSEDNRLYQMVALGFGGYQALKMRGLKPAVMQLNETATTFSAVARLDELCRNGMGIYEAIVYVRKHTLYTNHTLVMAAEPVYTYEQFEKYVFPNIVSPAVKHFISGLFRDARLRLNNLTIELAEAKNCVSRLHAKVINFTDLSGERVDFKAITNGIDFNTWLMPEIMDFYHDKGILDKFNMPGENFREILKSLVASDLRGFKKLGRAKLNKELETRKNQYGKIVQIPEGALLYEFKRRFVSYKRPWMPFEHPDEFRSILFENDAHYIMSGMMAGNVGAGDTTYDRLQVMLHNIDSEPYLRERVHYITDYDESLSAAMSAGSDVSINVPEVGWEACGTSFMKDIGDLTMLISTNDGGVADIEPPPVLEVRGENYQEEIASLYTQMRLAAEIWRDDQKWTEEITRQLAAYLPIMSGARMMRDYLRYLFKTN
ncbi:glycogen/starch/alpha-glucan phosphorylase [Candidatus Saccharibacteria bacterium]|nr:glycogen/starch/alpha-glucan phosphorylase [Candidatus Saccharibacteria bacterium]